MPEETLNPSELSAILRGFLPGTLREQSPCQKATPPSPEELFDLVEDRLSATEREDLIERIVVSPAAQEALTDILAGMELSSTLKTEAEMALEVIQARWLERIRHWLSPPILVPALSVCLLLIVALPLFMQPNPQPADTGEVRSLEPGFFSDDTTPLPAELQGETTPTPSPSPTSTGDLVSPASGEILDSGR